MARDPSRNTPDILRQATIQYIADHPDRPLKARALARELGVAGPDYADFRALLRQMLGEGALTLGPGRALVLPINKGLITGIFRAHRRGFGFVQSEGRDDLHVPRGFSNGALDGDRVSARLLPARRPGGPRSAEIVRVIERSEVRWVGVVARLGSRWIVRAQGKSAPPVVHVDDPTAKSVAVGDLVVVEPLPGRHEVDSPHGVVIERLGAPSQTQAQILGVIRRFGIREAFPDAVRAAARSAAELLAREDFSDREDLRQLLTITIDPPDARDFDDAISLETLDGGGTRLGVHIADVAHFVPEGLAINAEALQRGNSVYFPGYVVPMLPEVLSNGVCSLQPGQARLTKSAFIDYDRNGRVLAARFANTVIRSHARLTYVQASAALEAGRAAESTQSNEHALDPQVVDLLRRAERLARAIQRRRFAAGMIALALPESAVRLNERGEVVDALPAETSYSHTIIEMFMIEANEAVCRLLVDLGVPHIRRVHGAPDALSDVTSAQLSAALGRRVTKPLDRAHIRELLEAAQGTPGESAVNFLILRSLAQAAYSPAGEGHFALASEHYCHFTSPIRRYADLTIHRLLDAHLRRRASRRARHSPPPALDLGQLGTHISFTERRAQEAEREVRTRLLLTFMRSKVGQVFDGVVSGVAPSGAFVQLKPMLAEGLVPIDALGRDRWEFDRRSGLLRGERSGRVVTIGQPVRVEVVAVDELEQEMTLAPEHGQSLGVAPGRPAQPASRKRGRGARKQRRRG
ncbi:MAG: VacB/RNase II family 3'-5' exoribonuclease [Phycisphaerae bacterium]